MRALLIVAHGSRLVESNAEIAMLSKKVARIAEENFPLVACAFLELADPSIPQGVAQMVEEGADSIVVVPYFLAQGTHVKNDIPKAVLQAQAEHPNVSITISNYFGASGSVPEMLAQLALEEQK